MRAKKYRQSDLSFVIREEDAESKQAILRAALHLYVQHGVDSTPIRTIAERAGFSNPVIFKFFPDKAALTMYLFDACYAHLFDRLQAAIDPSASFEDKVRGAVKVFLSFVEQDLEALLFVQENLRVLWPQSSVKGQSLLKLFGDLIRSGHSGKQAASASALQLKVAAWVGLFAQLGRLAYFDEVKVTAPAFENELCDLLLRIARSK